MSKPFFITTPIYYVNDVPHIGHAYTTVAADVLARYRRLRGDDVFFLTGLDEHGQKVQQAAAKAGIEPQQHCDRLATQFLNLWKRLNISHDAFIRTTDAAHKRVVQQKLQELFDQGEIYQDSYTGWYCTFDERFWTEKDVVDGTCPDCLRPVERLSEKNYFFRMGAYQDRLKAHITANPDCIRPETRRNEVLGFLQKPLEDLSISRPKSRLSWGIELPFDSAYVTYVWFDALVNYVSALEYLAPSETGRSAFQRYWPATIHLVGKDILTTHAVYWSTILMALKMPLPQSVFAHGWWTVEGEKMSKSRGNVVDPHALADEFGVDQFRYFLLREVPFGNDGDFSRDSFIGRINNELANDLGNLLSRTLKLIERFAESKIPQPVWPGFPEETEVSEIAKNLFDPVEDAFNAIEFHRALAHIWKLVQRTNQFIEQTAPWNLAKKERERERLATSLYTAAEALRFIALYLKPFMPDTAEEIYRQLGLDSIPQDALKSGSRSRAWGSLPHGNPIRKGKPLFPRIVELERVQSFEGRLETKHIKGEVRVSDQQPTGSPSAGPAVPQNPEQVTLEDFQKIQLKVAVVREAERVPKSEKLIKLQVDLGGEQRQIVAGIGKKYEPSDLVGRRIVIVANLKPAKLMGVESQGMVLAAGDKDVGGLVTVQEEIEPGTKVK